MQKYEPVLAAPPVGVAGLSLFGVGLSDWVLLLTLIYTIFLIIDKLPTVIARVVMAYRALRGRRTTRTKE